MTYQTLFILIISITIFGFIFDQFIDYLNAKWFDKPIPAILSDVYDKEKYIKQQNYKLENYRFGIISSCFSFILILLMLLFDGFAFVNNIAYKLSDNYILHALIFFGIIFLALDILNSPFSYYSTFVIEEKYGFNKYNKKLFIFDKIKSLLLLSIIGGGLIAIIIYIYHLSPTYFWLIAWAVITAFSIFINIFYSSLIVPIFNKQKPLEEGALKMAILEFANKVNFKLTDIFVIDGSKRSSKANAYFSGLGRKKRIVLYDTLIDEMETDEIVAVLAHEIGHYKNKDVYKNLFTSIVSTGIFLYILGLFVGSKNLSLALGVETASFHIAIIAFAIIFSPISNIISIILSYFSRKAEFAADNYAAKNNLSDSLISALKKLASQNMSNLTPHPWVVALSYSHPPILDRVNNLEKKTL